MFAEFQHRQFAPLLQNKLDNCFLAYSFMDEKYKKQKNP